MVKIFYWRKILKSVLNDSRFLFIIANVKFIFYYDKYAPGFPTLLPLSELPYLKTKATDF